jgi:ABC-2 type transport system permease protein
MSGAMFRVMLLSLLRDRGALAMSLLVPAAFFVIFASIYPTTTGEVMQMRVALAVEGGGERGAAVVRALATSSKLEPIGGERLSGDDVRRLVRSGSADVGLISVDDNPPFLIVSDPARGVAAQLIAGALREALHAGSGVGRGEALPAPYDVENVAGHSAGQNGIAYYAGAVAVLFLLFSAVHGAITLLEESESGLLDRILVGPGSISVLVNGKFLYLVVQGFVQITVIFPMAWLIYGVDLSGHVVPWALTTLVASATCAAFALTLVTACATKRQAQTLANVVILVLSALGGSMVPRFLMPPLMQDIGWITPNTWALEAYTAIFWRDEPVSSLLLPWVVLVGAATVGLLLTHRLARRFATL